MKQGNCPKCNNENLDYEASVPEGESIYYPFKCKTCGFVGKEYYSLSFMGFYDNHGNEVEDK